jgi:hypothetical protein
LEFSSKVRSVRMMVGSTCLKALYDTDQPTRKQIEEDMAILEGIERGQCRDVIATRRASRRSCCLRGIRTTDAELPCRHA